MNPVERRNPLRTGLGSASIRRILRKRGLLQGRNPLRTGLGSARAVDRRLRALGMKGGSQSPENGSRLCKRPEAPRVPHRIHPVVAIP